MNIYFAGSIRAGRNDQELYQEIIKKLSRFGAVLTEHVGDKKVFEREEEHTDQEIAARDLKWLQESDFVIAEVTTPSLGVGYEIAKAEDMGKKILCLYRGEDRRKLSAMITGSENLTVAIYRDLNDLDPMFESFFRN